MLQMVALVLASCALLAGQFPSVECGTANQTIRIAWLDFPPCQILKDWVATTYVPANVEVACPPIGDWYSTAFHDYLLGADGKYELAGLDSQWIGEAVTKRYLLEISSYVQGALDPSDFYPAPLASYGEYPPNSGEYFGVPFEPDVMVLMFRKDIFQQLQLEDPFSQSELLEIASRINEANLSIRGYSGLWCSDPVLCYVRLSTFAGRLLFLFGGKQALTHGGDLFPGCYSSTTP